MTTPAETATATVRLQHHYPVEPGRVFRAWIDPDQIGRWFGPHSRRCEVERFEPHVGGGYRLRLLPESGDRGAEGGEPDVCAGTFVEIVPDERLVMTFAWVEGGADVGETLLTIELAAAGGGTDLVLTHERLPAGRLRDAHEGGWQGALESLESYLAAA